MFYFLLVIFLIRFPPVRHLYNQNEQDLVLYLVENPVIPRSNTVDILRILEFGAVRRTRIRFQFIYLNSDSFQVLLWEFT